MNEPTPTPVKAPEFSRSIHLLYVPTLYCNLNCSYCYLGEQTSTASLREDSARAVATLRHTLDALEAARVLAFNVSLHGGEVTTLPPAVLEELFVLIRGHYLRHFDALTALGHRKAAPHIKTNLFKFAPLYDLFDRHKVSISASIDLPLALHGRHRTTRGGNDWLDKTRENLRLLARYPNAKKISATLAAEHLQDIPALIDDIWFIHRELGFDMNQMNLMFAFASELNDLAQGAAALQPATPAQQLALYDALQAAFTGTELEEGLKRHWFDEFKPSYCTNSINCGERFYLLQSDGGVYSCVRGQGIEAFRYGNVFDDGIDTILANGARKIAAIHQEFGFDGQCRSCDHLAFCHTGCPVVKYQRKDGRSYTCDLQKALYRDNPKSYPAASPDERQDYARHYVAIVHPALAFVAAPPPPAAGLVLPGDLDDAKNGLAALIAADPILRQLYRADGWIMEVNGERHGLQSQILQGQAHWHTLLPGDSLHLHVRTELFEAACPEPIRNTVYVQMLRDTPVVYGDEQRSKQEHLFTYQIYRNCLLPSPLGADWLMADLSGIVAGHHSLYRRGVRNNLLVTTGYLRDYHYQKQKNNAFYHIQAVNLPFQNFEFHYLPGE